MDNQNVNSLVTGLADSLNKYMGMNIENNMKQATEQRKLANDKSLKEYDSALDTKKGKELELFKGTVDDTKKRGQSVTLSQLADDPEFGSLASQAPNAIIDAKDLFDYRAKKEKGQQEKAPKEFQYKASNYLKLAQSAETSLGELGKHMDLSSWSPVGRANATPEILRGADWKQFMQARQSIAQAYLRPATGATINADEYADVDRIFIPMPGDKKEVLAKKAAARANLMTNLKAESEGKVIDNTLANTAPKASTGKPKKSLDAIFG